MYDCKQSFRAIIVDCPKYPNIRMPLAYLFSYIGWGLNGIWLAVLISHVAASVASGICGMLAFKKGKGIGAEFYSDWKNP